MAVPVGQICSVFKLRIGTAIAVSALAGAAISPGAALSALEATVLALATLGASAAAGAFNQYAERDVDALMARTRERPFVTGAYRAGPLWLLGMGVLLAGATTAAALALNPMAALFVFLGAFVYGVVYTVWLKRRTWLNIVVGGLSGSFAVLAGAAAVEPKIATAPAILAAVMFLWTPPHFWSLATALRADYAAARIPMLPVVVGDKAAAWVILAHTVLLVLLSLVPAALGMGPIYLAGAATGGAWFIACSIRFAWNPGRTAAMRNFHASLLQLGLLLAAIMVDAWLPL